MALVHFGDFDRFIVATSDEGLASYRALGYESCAGFRAETVARAALRKAPVSELAKLWPRAIGLPFHPQTARPELERRLTVAVSAGRLVCLEKRVTRYRTLFEPPELDAPPQPPLEAGNESISLFLVDRWGNAEAAVSFELEAPGVGTQPGAFDASGAARVDGLMPGAGALRMSDLHPDEWHERAAPPGGWLRKGVALRVVDAHGEPIAGKRFKVTFENGAVLEGKLDADGQARIEETPSYPYVVTLPDFDGEDYR